MLNFQHLPQVHFTLTFFHAELVRILEDLFASLNENSHEATVLFLTMQNAKSRI
jgi:hypothetical protein